MSYEHMRVHLYNPDGKTGCNRRLQTRLGKEASGVLLFHNAMGTRFAVTEDKALVTCKRCRASQP